MTAREKRRRARECMQRLRSCPAWRACEAAVEAKRRADKRRDPDYRFAEKLRRVAREERQAA